MGTVYEYAKVLQTPNKAPIGHWSQGVSNIVSALMGGYLQNKANRDSQLRDIAGAKLQPTAPNAPPQSDPLTSDLVGEKALKGSMPDQTAPPKATQGSPYVFCPGR